MKKYAIIFLSIIGALFIAQCSKRSNPVDMTFQHGSYWTLYFRSASIDTNAINETPYRNVLVYTPPGYDPGDTLRGVATDTTFVPQETTYVDNDTIISPPDTIIIYGDTLAGTYYPVLYLLHGYGGDETYFRGLYDVGDILDEMISSGQIKPMIVVTPNATNTLGGSFYTNSPPSGANRSYAGLMRDYITNDLTHVIDSVFNTYTDRWHRGIAGHSMGGYGAVKLGMLRNDLYGSVSSMSGPLAFWGQYPADTAFLGLISMIPVIFEENGGEPGDQATFNRITIGPGKRLTNMMFAMAAAFSPHDPDNSDMTYSHHFTTLQSDGEVDLPFDHNGQIVPNIWLRWMANDVTSLCVGGYGGVFDSTSLYLDAGDKDDLYFNLQTMIFNAVAHANQFEIYSGGSGRYTADHISMISTRLPKVLKFHDAVFNR